MNHERKSKSSVRSNKIDEPTTPPSSEDELGNSDLKIEELLIEDISIDGMCGVY